MPQQYEDFEIAQEFMQRLRRKYAGTQRKVSVDGYHLTSLIYCITQAFWRDKIPFEPTDKEVLLWAVGLGLEQILLEDGEEHNRPVPKVVDGITVSPDYLLLSGNALAELKTNRLSVTKGALEPKNGWPATWVEQMMGYSKAYGLNTYRLGVYLVIAADLLGRRFEFEQQELDTFWAEMLYRKSRLEEAVAKQLPPEPFAYLGDNGSWQCERCAALTFCNVAKDLKQYIPKEVQV